MTRTSRIVNDGKEQNSNELHCNTMPCALHGLCDPVRMRVQVRFGSPTLQTSRSGSWGFYLLEERSMSVTRMAMLLGPIVLIGCAKENKLETSAASGAVRSAEAVGADDVPQASLHLQLAKEQIAAAEKLNADGDEAEAKSMLARAAADAELALLLSNEQSQKDEADAAMKRVTELRGTP